jgi:threonine synthase
MMKVPESVTVCPACGREGGRDLIRCEADGCAELVEVRHAAPLPPGPRLKEIFAARRGGLAVSSRSGVWRFRELIHPAMPLGRIISIPEGATPLFRHARLLAYAGLEAGAADLAFKHEGMNPTGSFKDRGMTVGASEARRAGARAVACASTGNTSASLAAYAAQGGLAAVVFIPEGQIAYGKLAQTLAYGARVVQVPGSFDDAMRLVERAAPALGLYLLNSVNPWRIEGQKAIAIELLEEAGWDPPDWIALPAGNLGNTAALGKALREARAAGLIRRVPRIAAVQAAGAAPFFRLFRAAGRANGAAVLVPEEKPETVATAIRIGAPRSYRKALAALRETEGVVTAATDAEILEAKAEVDRAGIGCEPASAAALAGVRKLVAEGTIAKGARVVCILTGHVLKDPEATVRYHTEPAAAGARPRANHPVRAPAGIDALKDLLARLLDQ